MGKLRDRIFARLNRPTPTLKVPYYKMIKMLEAFTSKDIETSYTMYLHLKLKELTFENIGQFLLDERVGARHADIKKVLDRSKGQLMSERQIRKALKRKSSKAQQRRRGE